MTIQALIAGDSHAAPGGYSTTTPAKAWSALFATACGKTVVNVAQAGHCAADQAAAILSKDIEAGGFGVLSIGTNDYRAYGDSAPRMAGFVDCQRAYLVHMAANVRKGTNACHTYTGSGWADSDPFGGGTSGGRVSSTVGDKVTIPFNGDVVYITGIRLGFGAAAAVKVMDGSTDKGTYSFSGPGLTSVQASASAPDFGPRCIAVRGFGPGAHSVTVEVLSGSFYFTESADATPHAHSFLMNIPYALEYSGGGSQAIVDAYNTQKVALISELQGDGVSAHLVNVNTETKPSDMADSLHCNDAGHVNWFNALVTKYNAIMGASIALMPKVVTYGAVSFEIGSDGLLYAKGNGARIAMPSA